MYPHLLRLYRRRRGRNRGIINRQGFEDSLGRAGRRLRLCLRRRESTSLYRCNKMGFKAPFSTARNRFKGQNLICYRDLPVNLTRKRNSVLRRLKIRICFQDYQANQCRKNHSIAWFQSRNKGRRLAISFFFFCNEKTRF